MSLRLRLASRWGRGEALLGALERVETLTIGALDALLEKSAPAALAVLRGPPGGPIRTLDERRAAMATAQNARVKALVDALGREVAVRIGREALFPVGMTLGREARKRLDVGDSAEELGRAAAILYRALGIDFTLEARDGGGMMMRVHRCALAGRYTEEACEILSAADEGVVAGLSPKFRMSFEERMTGGHPCCLARIWEARE